MPIRKKQEGVLAVLGADTTVTLDNTILGKPEDAADAARMLRLLSGRTHRVITGVALVTAAGVEVAAEATAVRFLTLSDAEIADYVAGGEPMDKAGAYAIQGRAARWIPRIEGCYFNVIGLPLALVSSLLESWTAWNGHFPAQPSPRCRRIITCRRVLWRARQETRKFPGRATPSTWSNPKWTRGKLPWLACWLVPLTWPSHGNIRTYAASIRRWPRAVRGSLSSPFRRVIRGFESFVSTLALSW